MLRCHCSRDILQQEREDRCMHEAIKAPKQQQEGAAAAAAKGSCRYSRQKEASSCERSKTLLWHCSKQQRQQQLPCCITAKKGGVYTPQGLGRQPHVCMQSPFNDAKRFSGAIKRRIGEIGDNKHGKTLTRHRETSHQQARLRLLLLLLLFGDRRSRR